MSITYDISNGRKIGDYGKATAVTGGNDTLLMHPADGTGEKQLPLSVLKAYAQDGIIKPSFLTPVTKTNEQAIPAGGTGVTVATIDLPVGTYILYGAVRVKNMASGAQGVLRYTTISGTTLEVIYSSRQSFSSSGVYTSPSDAIEVQCINAMSVSAAAKAGLVVHASAACTVVGAWLGGIKIA